VGCLIPDDLRGRWHLHRGTSRRILPALLPTLPPLELFVHDSLHTYGNMRYEFQATAERAAAASMLISDDVHGNAAFLERAKLPDVRYSAVVREASKPGSFGLCVLGRG
jgi:hypothetical protein